MCDTHDGNVVIQNCSGTQPLILFSLHARIKEESSSAVSTEIYRVIPIHTPVYIWIAEVKGE